MKSQLTSRCTKAITSTLVLLATLLVAVQADAHHRHHHRWWHYWAFAPVAYCAQYNTNTPLLPYVCCKQLDRHRNVVWDNTWVYGGSCKYASPTARPDVGCGPDSLVYGTDHPIIARCQFSSPRFFEHGYHGVYKH